EGPPDSWRVILDPKYKGRIAMYDDGIGFFGVAQLLGGGTIDEMPEKMAPTWETFRKLADNEPLLGEDPDLQQWFQNGEIDLACTIISNARAARKNGIPVAWTVPKEGASLHSDALWVPKSMPDNVTYWAKQYVNFALAPGPLETWANGLGLPPARPGLNVPEDLRGQLAYPNKPSEVKQLIRIPSTVLARNSAKWFRKFYTIMQG